MKTVQRGRSGPRQGAVGGTQTSRSESGRNEGRQRETEAQARSWRERERQERDCPSRSGGVTECQAPPALRGCSVSGLRAGFTLLQVDGGEHQQVQPEGNEEEGRRGRKQRNPENTALPLLRLRSEGAPGIAGGGASKIHPTHWAARPSPGVVTLSTHAAG